MAKFRGELLWMLACVAGLYVQVASPSTVFQKCYPVGSHEHCFRTVHGQEADEKRSWSDAWSYCKDTEGNYSLVAVDELDVQVALNDFIEHSDLIDTWIWMGLNQTTQGQWSWIDQTTYSGITSLPKVSLNLYMSGFIQKDSGSRVTLGAENSTAPMMYFCQFNALVCTHFKNNSVQVFRAEGQKDCYVTFPRVTDKKRSWYEARNKCLRLGGDLAIMKTVEHRNAVRNGLTTDERYWIGLQRDPLMKALSGVDKGKYAPLKYTMFRPDSPSATYSNESCIAFETGFHHHWSTNGRSCIVDHHFVCHQVSSLIPVAKEVSKEPPFRFHPVEFGGIVAGTAVVCVVATVLIMLLIIRCRSCISRRAKTPARPMPRPMHRPKSLDSLPTASTDLGDDSISCSSDRDNRRRRNSDDDPQPIYHDTRYR